MGLDCITAAVRNRSSTSQQQHRQPTSGKISLCQAVPQRDAYAEAAMSAVTARMNHLFRVHRLLPPLGEETGVL